MILPGTLIVIAALALTTSANPMTPRDYVAPQPKGKQQGSLSSDLTFRVHASPNCDGDWEGFTDAYGNFMPENMNSYQLSRALHDTEVLDFYAGDGTGLPHRHSTKQNACSLYAVTAGINATTDDDDPKDPRGKASGCHTLRAEAWCAMIWIDAP